MLDSWSFQNFETQLKAWEFLGAIGTVQGKHWVICIQGLELFSGLRLGNDNKRQLLGPTDRAVSKGQWFLVRTISSGMGTNMEADWENGGSTARKLQNMTGKHLIWGNNEH